VHPDLDGALGDHVDAAGQQVQANQSFWIGMTSSFIVFLQRK
jgi:hypothetical protein